MDTSFVDPKGVYVGQGKPGGVIYDRAFIRKYEDPQGTGANQLENNFPILRFRTNESNEKEKLTNKLNELLTTK